MQPFPDSESVRAYGGLVLLVALMTGASAAPPEANPPSGAREISALQRLIRRFDFEEREDAPYEMPIHLHRHKAIDQGFPLFGEMALTDEVAQSGNWSFGFELDGGSLSARLPTGVVPILPMSDYLVTANVRTEGLTHSRARVRAGLFDVHGRIIAESMVQCSLIRTNGAWEHIEILVSGDFEQAADLYLELQLVQPTQFGKLDRDDEAPVLEDVNGRAWFDDVLIWQVPHVELSMGAPGNAVVAPESPTLQVTVRDLTTNALSTRLVILDLDGNIVQDRPFDPPRGSWAREVELLLPSYGWFRAIVDVSDPTGLIGRQWVDFVYLPPQLELDWIARQSMQYVLPEVSSERLAELPSIIRRAGVGGVVLPVWNQSEPAEILPQRYETLRQVIHQMLAARQQFTFALDRMPKELAATSGLEPDEVFDLLLLDPSAWGPYLEQMLISLGQQVRRWQIGNAQQLRLASPSERRQAMSSASDALTRLVPAPIVTVPWMADQETGADIRLDGYTVTVPYAVTPSAIAEYVVGWPGERENLMVVLELTPADLYGQRDRVTDLLLRTLHTWRADIPRMAIESPWVWRGHDEGLDRSEVLPTPEFAVWRGLVDRLAGRSFAGEMPTVDGVECWILAGPDRSACVAWNATASPDDAQIQVMLADGPVEVVDAFGNREIIRAENGVHTIPVDGTPRFIENIDLQLARFRAGFEITPSFVPAVHRTHHHEIVLHNPWPLPISGTIQLIKPPRWEISPRTHDFVIDAGQEVRLPIEILIDRNVLSGRQVIDARVTISATDEYSIVLQDSLEIGLEELEHTASWTVADNPETGLVDLVITQFIVNKSDRLLHLDTHLAAPGTKYRRRQLPGLRPGQSILRSFRIPGGLRSVGGQSVRVGVSERDGDAKLNLLLEIPASAADESLSRVDQ